MTPSAAGSRSPRLAGVAVLALLTALPAPARAQGEGAAAPSSPSDSAAAVHGQVTVAETGEPLVNAVVHVVGRDRHAVVDSAGEFRIRGLEPGEVSVRAEYLGARTRQKEVTLEPGEAERVDFRADRVAVELTELTVEVERARRGKMAGFEKRRRRGHGDFITREDLDRHGYTRTTQVIRYGSTRARIRRTGRGEYRVFVRDGTSRCPPVVHLDGARMPNLRVNEIPPEQIEAIEIYGGAGTPVQFESTEGCGAVVIWTRTGG